MPFFAMFDPVYYLFLIPGLLLSLWAVGKTKATFAKYSRVPASSGLTGAEAAYHMLRAAGVTDVRIEPTRGMLTDHYDPRSHTLRLSEQVYAGRSLAAMGIACHEAGHALQHARGYALLGLRTALVPIVNFGSTLYMWIFIGGMLFRLPGLIQVAIILFALTVLFSIVTLPVEWNASARAKRALVTAGIVSGSEARQAGEVLNAAFMTYVASAVTAILTLLYYLFRSGLLGGGDD